MIPLLFPLVFVIFYFYGDHQDFNRTSLSEQNLFKGSKIFFDFWEDWFTEEEVILFLSWAFDPNIISLERIYHEYNDDFYRDMQNFDKITDPLLNF